MRTHCERSIEVRAPVDVTWACWERYGDFPEFVGSLAEVTPLAPDRIHWRARVAGIDREWTARVTERIPGRRIAWSSLRGTPNAGCVTFHEIGPGRTRVMLQLDYRPDGWIVAAGDLLRVPHICIDEALRGFKRYVEGADPDAAAPPLDAIAAPARSVGLAVARAPRAGTTGSA